MQMMDLESMFDVRTFLQYCKDQNDACLFLSMFCHMTLFTRLVERDKFPKSNEDRWDLLLFKSQLKPQSKKFEPLM